MRTLEQIREKILSAEEWDFLVYRTRRLLLLELLPEVGYDVSKMVRLKYSNAELKGRLVTQIRSLSAEREDLLRTNRQIVGEKEKQAQILFDMVGENSSKFK